MWYKSRSVYLFLNKFSIPSYFSFGQSHDPILIIRLVSFGAFIKEVSKKMFMTTSIEVLSTYNFGNPQIKFIKYVQNWNNSRTFVNLKTNNN